MRMFNTGILFQWTLIMGGIISGAYLSNQSLRTHHAHEHKTDTVHCRMQHGFIEVSTDSIVPEIKKIELIKDPMAGWNLYLQTANFTFTPENASKEHLPGQGHAHLYINGNKIARLYGNWFHIEELKNVENSIEVSLNANTHEIMMCKGIPISKMILVK